MINFNGIDDDYDETTNKHDDVLIDVDRVGSMTSYLFKLCLFGHKRTQFIHCIEVKVLMMMYLCVMHCFSTCFCIKLELKCCGILRFLATRLLFVLKCLLKCGILNRNQLTALLFRLGAYLVCENVLKYLLINCFY